MSSSEAEEFQPRAMSPSLLSSSSSSSSDADSEDENSGSVKSGHLIAELNKYNGFLRKPRKQDALAGRMRQERSYSDSENSYEQRTIPRRGAREERDFFDMESNADSRWGRQSLFASLDADQVESLVAWAHYGGTAPDNPLAAGPPLAGIGPQAPGQEDGEIERNPLRHLLVNTPLPLSFLNYFIHRASKVPEFHEGLYASFEDSALVAIGMIMEEIITASLLPLAGCHVLRCQQLEAKPSKDETLLAPIAEVSLSHPISCQPMKVDPRNLSENETAFTAWTLPPEEAMLKLVSQGVIPDTGIPLVRDPIRSCGSRGDKTFHVRRNKEVVHQVFQDISKNKTALDENRELLDLFLVSKKYKSVVNKVVKKHKRKQPPRENGGDASVQSDEPAGKKPRIVEEPPRDNGGDLSVQSDEPADKKPRIIEV
jgi:hypothetical protein